MGSSRNEEQHKGTGTPRKEGTSQAGMGNRATRALQKGDGTKVRNWLDRLPESARKDIPAFAFRLSDEDFNPRGPLVGFSDYTMPITIRVRRLSDLKKAFPTTSVHKQEQKDEKERNKDRAGKLIPVMSKNGKIRHAEPDKIMNGARQRQERMARNNAQQQDGSEQQDPAQVAAELEQGHAEKEHMERSRTKSVLAKIADHMGLQLSHMDQLLKKVVKENPEDPKQAFVDTFTTIAYDWLAEHFQRKGGGLDEEAAEKYLGSIFDKATGGKKHADSDDETEAV